VDERVSAPDQFGELFLGVADRFDRELGEIEDGCRPALWNRSRKSPTTIRSTSLPSWKSPRENDPYRMMAETCRRAPGKVPDLLDHPKSVRLAALQIESACSMHSPASSLS
jgi:hypothetical protein